MEPQKSEAGEEQQGDGVAAADVVGVAAGAADAALVGAVDAVGAVAAKGGAKDPTYFERDRNAFQTQEHLLLDALLSYHKLQRDFC